MKTDNCYEDSVFKVTYNFWAVGGILKFDIYNKLSVPVYIDWDRSNFILNGQSVSYANNTILIQKTIAIPQTIQAVTGKEYYVSLLQTGIMETQLPPHSYITVSRFDLNTPYYGLGHFPVSKDTIAYTYDTSILHFRNYIGYTTNQDLSDLKFLDNEFWIDKLITARGKYFNENSVIPYAFYNSYER